MNNNQKFIESRARLYVESLDPEMFQAVEKAVKARRKDEARKFADQWLESPVNRGLVGAVCESHGYGTLAIRCLENCSDLIVEEAYEVIRAYLEEVD